MTKAEQAEQARLAIEIADLYTWIRFHGKSHHKNVADSADANLSEKISRWNLKRPMQVRSAEFDLV